ncbi:MAG TPA: ATP-binding protein [Actinomycetota bacterium]|nr:ATP-binding protein [Actinomycetota bacterium]
MSSAFEVVLPPDPRAASAARQVVRELRGVLPPEVVGDVALLLTELVANSVRHAGLGGEDRIHVRIQLAADRVAVEVVDDGLGFRPSERAEGGWGLYLVDRLADRWGIQRDGATVAWFEIDLPPRGGRFRPGGGGVQARRVAGRRPDEERREGPR